MSSVPSAPVRVRDARDEAGIAEPFQALLDAPILTPEHPGHPSNRWSNAFAVIVPVIRQDGRQRLESGIERRSPDESGRIAAHRGTAAPMKSRSMAPSGESRIIQEGTDGIRLSAPARYIRTERG